MKKCWIYTRRWNLSTKTDPYRIETWGQRFTLFAVYRHTQRGCGLRPCWALGGRVERFFFLFSGAKRDQKCGRVWGADKGGGKRTLGWLWGGGSVESFFFPSLSLPLLTLSLSLSNDEIGCKKLSIISSLLWNIYLLSQAPLSCFRKKAEGRVGMFLKVVSVGISRISQGFSRLPQTASTVGSVAPQLCKKGNFWHFKLNNNHKSQLWLHSSLF